MKTRTCFVSNSSSCSFILTGFVLDESKYTVLNIIDLVYEDKLKNEVAQEHTQKNWDELIDDEKDDLLWVFQNELGICITDSDEDGCPKGKIMVGNRISLGDDCAETQIISADSITKDLGSLKEKFPDETPCVVTGSMMC